MPAEWDVTSQLFWRDEHTQFTEESSVRVAHIAQAELSEAKLVLPPALTPYVEFRIDLTLSFALLELRAIRVLDAEDGEMCRWTIPDQLLALQAGGLHSILTEDGQGALVLNAPLGSQVRLTLPEGSREALQKGATFLIHMKALDANGFTQKMAAAYGASETRHRQVEEGLLKSLRSAEAANAESAKRVNELERSFLHRLARRFL